MTPRFIRRSGAVSGLLFLTPLLLLQGCGGGAGQEGDGDSSAAADSVTREILGAIAQGPSPAVGPTASGGAQEAKPLDIALMGYNLGDSQAPVKVLEISDFGCGYCRRFHEEIFPVLEEAYVEEELVEWKFLPFVLGMFPNGLEAAMAAECAGEQDRFFPMQSRLFADQSQWKDSRDPDPLFAEFAGEEGLDVERFQQCLGEGWRDDAVRANIRLGREIGVRGTPTFLIDGVPISGALPVTTFRDILDMALAQRGLTPPAR